MAHLVSVWHHRAGVTLGQVSTADKSDEITALPVLLDAPAVQGATLTIDAMDCQHEIVAKTVEKKADYLIAVKNNLPCLVKAVESLFADPDAGLREGRLHHDVTLGKDHGRLETRRCVVSCEPDANHKQLKAWPAIENNFHWVLDVAFNEDACRVRRDHGAHNLAILRRIAVNLLKQKRSAKDGVKNKRLQAGWSTQYLEIVLGVRAR